MLLTKNGIRREYGVDQKRIWERSHTIPIYVYDFEEDEKYLNIISIIDGLLHGSVKVDYWDGEYHKERTKTIDEAKEYLKDKKNNFIDLEIKRSKRKDDNKIQKIYGTVFTSSLNKAWNSLRYLRCEKIGNENIRMSLLTGEFLLPAMKKEGVNKWPTNMSLFIEFGNEVSEEEAMKCIQDTIIRNGVKALNRDTTVYSGSVEGEAITLTSDIICKYFKLRELLQYNFVLPYPILVGRKELFTDRLLANDWPKTYIKAEETEFCLLNILDDVDKVECEYRDSFIQLTDDLKKNNDIDKEYVKSFLY